MYSVHAFDVGASRLAAPNSIGKNGSVSAADRRRVAFLIHNGLAIRAPHPGTPNCFKTQVGVANEWRRYDASVEDSSIATAKLLKLRSPLGWQPEKGWEPSPHAGAGRLQQGANYQA